MQNLIPAATVATHGLTASIKRDAATADLDCLLFALSEQAAWRRWRA